MNTIANIATSLNYVGLQASTDGATDHYFDNIQTNSSAAAAPALSEWGMFFLLLALAAGSATWMERSSVSEA
jgi:hypothetical protein